MANIKSAEKRNRQNAERAARNHSRISRVRTFLRKVEEALTGGDKKVAAEALKAAQPEIQRGVTKGVLRKKTASRKISRLAARVKALA
tara:strand:- start:5928 stop:6191 length:264 start_codon:yes stop_codon:yes gene_type:complete